MQKMMKQRAIEMLRTGAVTRVIGWKRGEFPYDIMPAVFESEKEIERDLVYDDFCGTNLTKFAFNHQVSGAKTLIFLKPCDTYSMAQLLSEHRIRREELFIIGIPCYGKIDMEKIRGAGMDGILSVTSAGADVTVETLYDDKTFAKMDVMAERCLSCKSKAHAIYDELLGEKGEKTDVPRFDEVERLEKMTLDERYDFWRHELSRCIRCNACRNACPACTCESCVFDNPKSGISQKVAADPFEENMFHIIRAFHVAGRCTDCGECSRVCPQQIPLHLLNRKFIHDIDRFYGEYQAGETENGRSPLVDYDKEDIEPGERGNIL